METENQPAADLPRDALRQESWDRALMADGTAYVFDRRAELLRGKLKLLAFLGLAVPVIVGGLVVSYGGQFWGFRVVIAIGGAITVGQFVMALASLVSGWVDGYEAAITSVVANRDLAQTFESLAKGAPDTIVEFRQKLDVLEAKDDSRRAEDYRLNVTEAEKHMGLRAALWQRQKSCVRCGLIPEDMTPTKCGVCGGFRASRYRAPRLHATDS